MDRCTMIRNLFEHGYRMVEFLGRGTEGEVFLVAEYGHPYACKIVKPRGERSEEASPEARLLRELSAMGRTAFPAFRESFSEGGIEYIVMEYIGGRDLKTYIDEELRDRIETDGRGGVLGELLRIATELADSLIILNEHDGGYTYGDLKPDNILIQQDGRVRIIDLGGATPVGSSGILGNLMFSAPERICGAGSGKTEDIYALGRVIDYVKRSCWAGASLELHDASRMNWLDSIIDRCLSPEPSRRVRDMRQLLDYLRMGQQGVDNTLTYRQEARSEYMSVQSSVVYGIE